MFPLSRSRRRRADRADPPVLDRQLRELIDEHASAVYHVAFSVLRDRGLAEDAVQETMIKAWKALPEFRGDSSMRTWVLRIAHNTAIDSLRRRRDRSTAPEDLPDRPGPASADDPATRVSGRDDLSRLKSALEALDETSRTIVVLREVEGLSYQQISETLGITIGTVKTRLLRARRTLQDTVKDQEDQ
ncbi:MAG: RNA polymerase sigma factor [Actinomycetota bacterium]|nr:RNA polymerase sigma factor [Actinomycetota bacterium]